MSRWSRGIAVVALGAVCSGWVGTAAAVDPLVLFLLRMIRDSVLSSAIEAAADAAVQPKPKPDTLETFPRLLAPAPEGHWLKALIDESFIHLSGPQREELHASLMRILNDPRYLESRGTILAEFTRQAIAMRDAHRQLAGLNPEQMKLIAVEARREYERLPSDQREQLLVVLQQGIPGMPRTLNEVMLAEFRSAGTSR
jgi:hypothetical protein